MNRGYLISGWMIIIIEKIWKGLDWMDWVGSAVETIKTGSKRLRYLCGLFRYSSQEFPFGWNKLEKECQPEISICVSPPLSLLLPRIAQCFVWPKFPNVYCILDNYVHDQYLMLFQYAQYFEDILVRFAVISSLKSLKYSQTTWINNAKESF